MSPMGKGLLASALTLPLVAFVAGVLASPDPVDPDRSRPVIIGRVSDDSQPEKPTPAPPERRGDEDDRGDRDREDDQDDRTDDQPGTAVSPPPRYVDDGDDDGDDGGSDDEDDRDDDSDDGGESGDD